MGPNNVLGAVPVDVGSRYNIRNIYDLAESNGSPKDVGYIYPDELSSNDAPSRPPIDVENVTVESPPTRNYDANTDYTREQTTVVQEGSDAGDEMRKDLRIKHDIETIGKPARPTLYNFESPIEKIMKQSAKVRSGRLSKETTGREELDDSVQVMNSKSENKRSMNALFMNPESVAFKANMARQVPTILKEGFNPDLTLFSAKNNNKCPIAYQYIGDPRSPSSPYICKLKKGYEAGPCGVEIIIDDTSPTSLYKLSLKCRLVWEPKELEGQDFSLMCPLNWSIDKSEDRCKPPATNIGLCGDKWLPLNCHLNQKVFFAYICQESWPSSFCQNRQGLCPIGYNQMDEWCTVNLINKDLISFDSMQCGKIRTDETDVIGYMKKCQVSWECQST